MSNNGNDIGAFLAGFVIGSLVGAATALILAPQSGEETRSIISTKSTDLRTAGTTRISDARQFVQDSSAQVQDRVRSAFDNGQEAVLKNDENESESPATS